VKAATLEIDVVIGELARLQSDLTAVKQGIGQTMGEAVRQHQLAERAATRYVDALEREAVAVGKTAIEVKKLEIAANAAAAEASGFNGLAEAIRATGSAVVSARIEAEKEAVAIRDAAAAHAAFEAAARRGALAMREEAAEAERLQKSADMRLATAAHAAFEAAVRRGTDAMREQEAVAARRDVEEHSRLAGQVQGAHASWEADAAAAERLRASTDPLYAATKRLNTELAESTRLYHAGMTAPEEYARQQAVLQRRLVETADAHRVAATAAQGNAFALKMTAIQIPDIVQGLLTGQKPMTVFLQQGGQIAQIAQMAEGGIAGYARSVGALALRFAPLIGAAGAAFGAFELIKSSVEDDAGLQAYSKTLGLTHSEMKKLKDVGVTTGDVMVGIWKTLNADSSLGDFIAKAKKWFGELRDDTIMVMKVVGETMYATFVGGYRASIETWRQWPAALADLTIQGANKAIAAVQALLNWTITGLNKLPGIDIGQVELGRLKNDYAGAGAAVGAVYASEFTKAAGEADKFFSTAEQNIIKASKERLKTQADEISYNRRASEAAAAKRKADREAEEAAKKAAKVLEDLAEQRARFAGEGVAETQKLVDSWNKLDVSKSLDKDLGQLGKYFDKNGIGVQMERQKQAFDDAADSVKRYADAFAEPFGRAGGAISSATKALVDYQTMREQIAQGVASKALTENQAAEKTAKNQIDAYASITGAAKGFFSEHSKIYKALQAAETTFRAVQLAMSIAAMVQNTAETGLSVANSTVRATAAGTAGIAAQAKLPFPANIAAMAATAAALVGVGVAVLGSIGGGGKNTLPAANTGTGTVLGDGTAQSDSIKRSIDALKDVDTINNSFAREMAASLKSIDAQIGGLASVLVRSGNISADSSVAQGFQKNIIGKALSSLDTVPILGLAGAILGPILGNLFGTKTSVIGSGIYSGAQSIGDIMSNGIDAQTYSDVQKKKKLFGITTSTKYSTVYGGAVDDSVAQQFSLILKSFDDAIVAAAGPLGAATGDIQNTLNSFVFSLGKIDLSGLSGTEIQDKLNAVFGAAADDMAQAAFPFITQYQKVGEGAFETLTRVASTVEAVTNSLDQLGLSVGNLGIGGKMNIADQFESVSAMTDAVDSYFASFYNKQEQAAARTAQFSKVFDSLGLTMPSTLAAFRSLVEAQDLTTAAGQATYATLLQLAPAFADLQTSLLGAKSAADILSEREDLQNQLLQLTGDTAAIRAAELAKLDPSNRILQQQIYAVQDAQKAADAAAQLKEAWTSVGDSIMDEVKRIRGLTDVGTPQGFAALLGQFNAATAAARAGDQDAAKSLPTLSQSLLTAAAAAATSQQELNRVQAQTAASLEATYAAISAFSGGAATPSTAAAALASAAGASAGSTSSGDATAASIAGLRQELADTRADLKNALATIAGNTGGIKKSIDNVTGPSGDTLQISAAA
jgi:hypothetical protein